MLCALIGGFCERASDKNEITASAWRASLSLSLSLSLSRARVPFLYRSSVSAEEIGYRGALLGPGPIIFPQKVSKSFAIQSLREGPRLEGVARRQPPPFHRRPGTVMKRNASNRIILRPVAFLINPNGRKSSEAGRRGEATFAWLTLVSDPSNCEPRTSEIFASHRHRVSRPIFFVESIEPSKFLFFLFHFYLDSFTMCRILFVFFEVFAIPNFCCISLGMTSFRFFSSY